MPINRQEHWNHVRAARTEYDVSWFEEVPAASIAMIEAAGLTRDSCVIDVGGGESRLVDHLLSRGLRCVAVLDVSGTALARARGRLGERASIPTWIQADVTADWSLPSMDIWHDRAVFHFLTSPDDQARYVDRLRRTVRPGGCAVIATFALDGPETCSGLPVARYSARTLGATLGDGFALAESAHHLHRTPSGGTQSFQYSRFTRL